MVEHCLTNFVHPTISDWNRFEGWLNGLGELSKLISDAENYSINEGN